MESLPRKKKVGKEKGPSVYWESEICPPAFLHDLNVPIQKP
jgi:hypothetical protein